MIPVTIGGFLVSPMVMDHFSSRYLVAILLMAPFALAPGQTQARVRANWVADENVTLLGLVPRMNTLGRVLDLTRSRAGQRQCLAHFGHWSVYDQQLFRSRTPVALAAGDVVTLTCELNTTSRSGITTTGESPDEEHCVAHLYLVEARR